MVLRNISNGILSILCQIRTFNSYLRVFLELFRLEVTPKEKVWSCQIWWTIRPCECHHVYSIAPTCWKSLSSSELCSCQAHQMLLTCRHSVQSCLSLCYHFSKSRVRWNCAPNCNFFRMVRFLFALKFCLLIEPLRWKWALSLYTHPVFNTPSNSNKT